MSNGLKLINSERGVIIPLLAVICVGVLIALVVLGVNASRVKYAALDLRTEANEICADLSDRYLGAQINVAREFVKRIDQYVETLPNSLELTSATIIAPTMPENFDLPESYTEDGQFNDQSAGFVPFLAGQSRDLCSTSPFFGADATVCDPVKFCATSGNCRFQGDVYYNIDELPVPGSGPAKMKDKYPVSLLHNLSNSGNTVLCEFRAKVKNLWLGTADQEISARVGFWQPAVGNANYFPDDPPPLPGNPEFYYSPPANVPFPGLSIAIATELTTRAGDERFQFTGGGPNGWSTTYNPNPVGGSATFTSESPRQGYSTGPEIFAARMSAPSQLDEARAACMSPVTLVRNTYLAALLEFAARHAHFRVATEILHINPQYRLVADPGVNPIDPSTISPATNFPALIVPFGADIAKEQFQLPYVSYFGGLPDNGDPNGPWTAAQSFIKNPPEFLPYLGEGNRLADGFINPFVNAADSSVAPFGLANSGLGNTTVNLHAVLASQLRSCYHLFNPGFGGIQRFHEFVAVDNPGFEDLDTFPYPERATFAPLPYGPSLPWGQDCPWGTVGTGCGPTGFGVPLTAAEVVTALGTTQSCPHRMNNGLQVAEDCAKPLEPGDLHVSSFDLRADIAGTMAYLGNQLVTPLPSVGSPIAMRAIKSPGLFRLAADDSLGSWTGLAEPNFPMGSGNYVAPALTSSSILVVMHQRLNNHHRATICNDATRVLNPALCSCAGGVPSFPQNEVCRIRCAVDQLQTIDPVTNTMVPRRITIAFFPTTYLDFSTEAIQNLQCAFNASTDAGNSTTGNLLFAFTPLDPNFTEACNPIPGTDCLIKYWKFLLTPDTGHNILDQARVHFMERFTAKGVKF